MTRDLPDTLFTPVMLGALSLSHRVVITAMRSGHVSDTGVPTDLMAQHYRERATEGGLIISEACAVSACGLGRHAGKHVAHPMAGLHTAEQVHQWQRVTRAVHERGGLVMAQLDHGLKWCRRPGGDEAVGKRENTHVDKPEAATHASLDVDDDALEAALIDYRNAAEHASDAGFDGVELHAVHGALPARLMAVNHDHADAHDDATDVSPHPRATQFLDYLTNTLINIWGADRLGLFLGAPLLPSPPAEEAWVDAYTTTVGRLRERGLAFVHVPVLAPPTMARLRAACPTGLLVSGDDAQADTMADTRADAMARVARNEADAIGVTDDGLLAFLGRR